MEKDFRNGFIFFWGFFFGLFVCLLGWYVICLLSVSMACTTYERFCVCEKRFVICLSPCEYITSGEVSIHRRPLFKLISNRTAYTICLRNTFQSFSFWNVIIIVFLLLRMFFFLYLSIFSIAHSHIFLASTIKIVAHRAHKITMLYYCYTVH